MLCGYDLDHKGINMNDHSELTQRKAEDIPEWELEEMIRDVIRQGADIAERALAWLDRVGTVLGVLRRELPGIVKKA
jgi:hypothetical protein